MSSSIVKGFVYDNVKERAEETFCNIYEEEGDASLYGCIEEALDYYYEDLMSAEEYEDIEDEDELMDLLKNELLDDLDEDDIIDNLEDDCEPFSDYERNYGII